MAGFLNWLKYTFKWTKYKENKLNKKENLLILNFGACNRLKKKQDNLNMNMQRKNYTNKV